MKMMNVRLTFAIFLGALLTFTACEKEDDNPAVVDTSDADLETLFNDSYEEVDAIVEYAMASFDVYGRVAEGAEDDLQLLIGCAERTHDLANKTIIIDFGDGCVGLLGRVRKGIVHIQYTGRMFMPGSKTTVTFEGFYINDVLVEGVRTIENVSATLNDPPRFHVMLENGKLTWPEEQGNGFAEREVNQYRTWMRGVNPLSDEFHVEGIASGRNRNNVQYAMEILSPVKYRRACWAYGVFMPVEGVKEIITDNREVLIDFGTGECDRELTVTIDGKVHRYQHRWPGR